MKIKIAFAVRPYPSVDFGNFQPDRKDHVLFLNVDFWKQYVDARSEFEMFHSELVEKAKKKAGKKFCESLNME